MTPTEPEPENVKMGRLTTNLPVPLLEEIERISRATGVTRTAVLRQMLELGLSLRNQAKEGTKILTERDGKFERLVFM